MRYNIETVENGRVKGWIKAQNDGCPSKVQLQHNHRELGVYATLIRKDVLDAGHSLFSGFDLNISSSHDKGLCQVKFGHEIKNVSPSLLRTSELIKVDHIDTTSIEGWINDLAGIRSLIFFHDKGVSRSQIMSRHDVNAHLGTEANILHGFSVEHVDVSSIYAINVNNQHVHLVGGDFFKR